jgi:7-carboxy-7-deazaguanine synthase
LSTYRGAVRAGAGALLVSEVFGPTLQGEGPSAGRTAVFVRLGMCNLACAWCDTAYTWDAGRFDLSVELRPMPAEEVTADVLGRPAPLVVVTGGEPLLQAEALVPVVAALRQAGRRVEFETAGTVLPGHLAGLADRFVVSPKLSNSGLPEGRRLRWPVLEEFAAIGPTAFKFVVSSPEDLSEVDRIVEALALDSGRVWVMPEGVTADAIAAGMRDLADGVTGRGWALSGRLHVLLWGDARGR